jgi:hypothetical protein
MPQSDPAIEYRFTLADMWSRRLFVALLRRYGLRPYRYDRQRYTTVMARVPKRFVDETLWPEYTELNSVLRTYLDETIERVISRFFLALRLFRRYSFISCKLRTRWSSPQFARREVFREVDALRDAVAKRGL